MSSQSNVKIIKRRRPADNRRIMVRTKQQSGKQGNGISDLSSNRIFTGIRNMSGDRNLNRQVVRDLGPSLSNLYPKLYKWHNTEHIYVPGRYLVLQIPKTGSTFISKSLIQQRKMNKFKEIYRHEGAGEWIRELGVEEWLRLTTVAVVRNPFDQILSFYFHQRKHNEIPKEWDFDRAVREMISKRNPHVYQYKHICNADNRIIVKHVFKYEQGLGEIMRQIETLGIKPEKRIDARVMVNPSPGKPTRNQINRYLTNSVVKLIQEEFARDFDLLGYSMDPEKVGQKELKGVVGGMK